MAESFEVDYFEVESYDDPYVRTPLEWCRAGLHWEDLGLLTWLRSHRPGFRFTESFIINASPAGRDKVRVILRRLEQAGYLKRSKIRDAEGKFRGAKLALRATADPVVAALRAAERTEPSTEKPSVDTDQRKHPDSGAARAPSTENSSMDTQQGKQGVSAGSNPRTDFPTPVNPHQRKNIYKEPPPPTPSTEPKSASNDAVALPEEAEEGATDHRSVAAGLVGALPGALTAGQRHRLAEAAVARLAAGWTAGALRAELTADLDGVRSLAAVYGHRLARLPDTPPPDQAGAATIERPIGGEVHQFEPDPADPDACRRCPRPKTNRIHTTGPNQISRTETVRPAPGLGSAGLEGAQGRSGRRGSGPVPAGDAVAAVLTAAGVGHDAA